jgi:fumarate reductase subunit C
MAGILRNILTMLAALFRTRTKFKLGSKTMAPE